MVLDHHIHIVELGLELIGQALDGLGDHLFEFMLVEREHTAG
jgi:hypothetical protein